MIDGSIDAKQRKPIRVTFFDGTVCDVGLSASYQVPPEKAPYLIAAFGTYGQAEAHLFAVIGSSAFATLERRTSSEARKLRTKTEHEIFLSARTKAARIGFTLHKVGLLEITQVVLPSLRGQQTMEKIRILFVAANPIDTPSLKLDEEVREIEAKIRAAELRESLELITKWAVRPDDLLQSLNQHKPHVVHFSGHGSSTEEIILLDKLGKPKPVSKEALVSLFRNLKDNIRVVLLNACFSRPQAEAITGEIDCAIGMTRAIGDDAAIIFAASFYRAIGFGRSVKDAFGQGKTALLLEGIPEEKTPELMTRENIAAESIVLITPQPPIKVSPSGKAER